MNLIQKFLNRGSGGMNEAYVHGYHPRETSVLQDQAGTLVDLLALRHLIPSGKPGARKQAAASEPRQLPWLGAAGRTIYVGRMSRRNRSRKQSGCRCGGLPMCSSSRRTSSRHPLPRILRSRIRLFRPGALSRPDQALAILNSLLRPGGTMTVIEDDHGSAYFHPDSSAAQMAIQCLVELQRSAGGTP